MATDLGRHGRCACLSPVESDRESSMIFDLSIMLLWAFASPCHNIDQNLSVMGTGRPRVHFPADTANGFWAILIFPPHRERAGVVTPSDMNHYSRLAQGLKGGSQTYAKLEAARERLRKKITTKIKGILPEKRQKIDEAVKTPD